MLKLVLSLLNQALKLVTLELDLLFISNGQMKWNTESGIIK